MLSTTVPLAHCFVCGKQTWSTHTVYFSVVNSQVLVCSTHCEAAIAELNRKSATQLPFYPLNTQKPNEVVGTCVVATDQLINYTEEFLRLQYQTKYRVVLPLQVVQDIDRLKDDIYHPACGKAKEVNQLLYNLIFQQQANWLSVQQVHQIFSNDVYYGSQFGADDRILDCALFFAHSSNKDNIVLLTQDKTLSIKAFNNVLRVQSLPELLAQLQPATEVKPVFIVSRARKPHNSRSIKRTKFDTQIKRTKRLTRNEGEVSAIESLPDEVIKRVLSFLSPRETLAMACVNKTFNTAVGRLTDQDWCNKLRTHFQDTSGCLVPSVDVKQWYILWRRRVLSKIGNG